MTCDDVWCTFGTSFMPSSKYGRRDMIFNVNKKEVGLKDSEEW